MIQKIRSFIIGGILIGSFASGALVVSTPITASAACNATLLTFPAWYRGIVDDSCKIESPAAVGGIGPFVWKIVFNVVEIMLQLVVYLCIGYLIYGGFKYLTSAGQSARITSARNLILNALVGLVISFISVAIVSFIGESL